MKTAPQKEHQWLEKLVRRVDVGGRTPHYRRKP